MTFTFTHTSCATVSQDDRLYILQRRPSPRLETRHAHHGGLRFNGHRSTRTCYSCDPTDFRRIERALLRALSVVEIWSYPVGDCISWWPSQCSALLWEIASTKQRTRTNRVDQLNGDLLEVHEAEMVSEIRIFL
jgi:hypothetical protein